ncbi:CDP-glycerol glycerophosphotransferase family protein [Microbacterium album]|uniref:Teichoic acid biosynthesis protein n=1 Tax=Microbacterium album TaxID=2053191 RepID=A0A917IBL8_9MICO|nr:CDP-glycerol glycerophosphotransferase family protein [Microbacterium album]GGH33706.1 teichoic acid biosynthesis protein [Microbacterium album]
MASFSFGAGNARKIARLPLYALGRLVTLLTPRTDRWVFGCGAGIGDGPLAVWDVAAEHGRDAVWLTDDRREARAAAALGIPTIRKSSLRGFWATARAGVIVVAYGFGDVNPYGVGGGLGGPAVIAQLWHGIPLKRIGLDSAETLRSPVRWGAPLISRLLGAMYRRAARRIRVLPAASHLVRGRLESAFGLGDDRVVVTGEPRVDVLSAGSPQERRDAARALLERLVPGIAPDTRLVLYAPTWRDGEPDPAIPGAADWEAIEGVLARQDAVLLIRSHRLGAGAYVPPPGVRHVRMLGADLLADVTPALPGLDVLVTDYSSLVYDAALVPLPVCFLAPDVAAYARRRGFYGSYVDVAGPDVATSWQELVPHLEAVLRDPAEADARRSRSRALSIRVHAFHDGRNAQRVYEAIIARSRAHGADSRRRPARRQHVPVRKARR